MKLKKIALIIFFLNISCNIYSQYYLNSFDFEKILFTNMNLRMLNITSICKKEYTYDINSNEVGNGHHCVYIDSNGKYSAVYYYDTNGREISKSINLIKNNNVEIILSTFNNRDTLWYSIIYDNEKNSMEIFYITTDHLLKSFNFHYNEPGLQTSKIICLNQKGDTSLKVTLNYNGFGQPIEEVDYMNDTLITSATVCEYDKNNKLNKIITKDFMDKNTIEQNFVYNSQGLPVKQLIYKDNNPFKIYYINYSTDTTVISIQKENIVIDTVFYDIEKLRLLPYYIKNRFKNFK